MLIIFAAVIWWLLGVVSMIYWWRTQYDVTRVTLVLAALVGFLGPFAFVVGWFLHSPSAEIVVIKKRGS
jgi:hypothetical protein